MKTPVESSSNAHQSQFHFVQSSPDWNPTLKEQKTAILDQNNGFIAKYNRENPLKPIATLRELVDSVYLETKDKPSSTIESLLKDIDSLQGLLNRGKIPSLEFQERFRTYVTDDFKDKIYNTIALLAKHRNTLFGETKINWFGSPNKTDGIKKLKETLSENPSAVLDAIESNLFRALGSHFADPPYPNFTKDLRRSVTILNSNGVRGIRTGSDGYRHKDYFVKFEGTTQKSARSGRCQLELGADRKIKVRIFDEKLTNLSLERRGVGAGSVKGLKLENYRIADGKKVRTVVPSAKSPSMTEGHERYYTTESWESEGFTPFVKLTKRGAQIRYEDTYKGISLFEFLKRRKITLKLREEVVRLFLTTIFEKLKEKKGDVFNITLENVLVETDPKLKMSIINSNGSAATRNDLKTRYLEIILVCFEIFGEPEGDWSEFYEKISPILIGMHDENQNEYFDLNAFYFVLDELALAEVDSPRQNTDIH